jgi:hypothetical protein
LNDSLSFPSHSFERIPLNRPKSLHPVNEEKDRLLTKMDPSDLILPFARITDERNKKTDSNPDKWEINRGSCANMIEKVMYLIGIGVLSSEDSNLVG